MTWKGTPPCRLEHGVVRDLTVGLASELSLRSASCGDVLHLLLARRAGSGPCDLTGRCHGDPAATSASPRGLGLVA
jgi:hypothetical protein